MEERGIRRCKRTEEGMSEGIPCTLPSGPHWQRERGEACLVEYKLFIRPFAFQACRLCFHLSLTPHICRLRISPSCQQHTYDLAER